MDLAEDERARFGTQRADSVTACALLTDLRGVLALPYVRANYDSVAAFGSVMVLQRRM